MVLQNSSVPVKSNTLDRMPAPIQIGPGRWLCLAYPVGNGAFVVEGAEVVSVRQAHDMKKSEAVVQDFWAARAVSALRQWRFETDQVRGELRVGGWTVAQCLGTDGRWHVVASKMIGEMLVSDEFCPDEIDFAAWINHL